MSRAQLARKDDLASLQASKPQTEAEITRAIRSLLHGLRIFHWKQHQGLGSTPGVPDIIGIVPASACREKAGCLLGIEVKTDKGRLSKDQEKYIGRINREGGLAFVARCVDDMIDNLGVRDRFLF